MIFLTVLFLLFHSPSGDPIFIARDQIVAVTSNVTGDNRAHSQIITVGSVNLYIRETPEEVYRKLSAGKDDEG